MKFVILLVSLLFVISLVNASVHTDTALLKVSMKQSEKSSNSFSIFSDKGGAVSLEAVNLQGVSFSPDSLILNSGESYLINVSFDSTGLSPGLYAGYIKIKTKESSVNFPVLLEVESKDLLFDGTLEIPPAYSLVSPGSQLVAKIQIYDLTFGNDGLSPKSVELEYFIYKNDGTLILSQSDSVVVDKDLAITKSINLPKELKEGIYFVGAVIKYGTSIGVASGIFDVSESSSKLFNFSSGSSILLAIFILIVLGGGAYFFIYLIHDRDKVLLELKIYNDEELEKQRKFLLEQQKYLLENKRCSEEDIKRDVYDKIQELKEMKEKRVREVIKVVNKQKKPVDKKNLVKNKLKEWKSKGYNTILLESKLKGVNSGDMKHLLTQWKKQGYK